MMPAMPMGKGGNRLRTLYQRLSDEDRQTLLAFAEFLGERAVSKKKSEPQQLQLPDEIERPQQESVVAAIRRLSSCYPMLEKETLLHETSDLMTSHVLKGRPAKEVIDDLESLFSTHYDAYRNRLEQD
ncbi:MAG: Crp/Fnr family transcriptional regulator [Pseudomonadota bacterium]